MRRLLLAACAVLAISPAALAKDYQLPAADPAFAVTLPDAWEPSDIDSGVEATSPDQETYIAVETAFAKSADALLNEDLDFLQENDVVIDKSSKRTQDTTINGLPVTLLHWDGQDKDGPASITLVLVTVTEKLLVLVTEWSSPAGDKSNGPALDDILSSFKRL